MTGRSVTSNCEIQRCDAHHPVLELNDEGLVEAEPLALHFDCFLRDAPRPPAASPRRCRRNYAQHEKDEDRYAEQRGIASSTRLIV